MEMSTLCRICLAKDVRMYDLVNTNLQETYESLTAMQIETKDSRPSQVCYICYAQLQTCHKLRSKSIHSEELFRQVSDSSELKLPSLLKVTPLLTIQLVTVLNIVPVSLVTNVKDDEYDDPGLDCPKTIDNVQVKTKHVEGIEDIFDADNVRRVHDNDKNNVSEAEDNILPLSPINNSEHRTSVASKDDVCPKTVKIVLQRLESTNIITSVPAPVEPRFTERVNKTVNGEEVVNDSSGGYINKTGYLLFHIGTVTDRPYKCDICGKCFKKKWLLLRHARSHTHTKAYDCDMCGKHFIRKDHLSSHILTHSGITAYDCDICKKIFTTSVGLSKHICRGIKTHTCNICGKIFKRKHDLSRHIGTHTRKYSGAWSPPSAWRALGVRR